MVLVGVEEEESASEEEVKNNGGAAEQQWRSSRADRRGVEEEESASEEGTPPEEMKRKSVKSAYSISDFGLYPPYYQSTKLTLNPSQHKSTGLPRGFGTGLATPAPAPEFQRGVILPPPPTLLPNF